MAVDWSKKRARKRDPSKPRLGREDTRLPELPPEKRAKRRSISVADEKKQLWETTANQKLVHEWLLVQCYIDPEFRMVYEDYIGPLPQYVRDRGNYRTMED